MSAPAAQGLKIKQSSVQKAISTSSKTNVFPRQQKHIAFCHKTIDLLTVDYVDHLSNFPRD